MGHFKLLPNKPEEVIKRFSKVGKAIKVKIGLLNDTMTLVCVVDSIS